MGRLTRVAAALAIITSFVACQPLREQKDEAISSMAAGLIAPVIEAQSADARSGEVEPAKLTDCNAPCDRQDVAPIETCRLPSRDGDGKVAVQKQAPRHKA